MKTEWNSTTRVHMKNKAVLIIAANYKYNHPTTKEKFEELVTDDILTKIRKSKWCKIGTGFFLSKEVVSIITKSNQVLPPEPKSKQTTEKKKWWRIW